jgi:beta-lactamase regulating signal transducer with metallopeptidase domain
VIEAVLNWIAQGLAVAVATSVGLRVLGSAPAHARYLVCWAALWVIVCLPVVPMLWTIQPSTVGGRLGESAGSGLLSVPHAAWNAPMVLGMLAALWIGGRVARLVAAVVALGRARRGCLPVPEPVLAGLDPSTKARLSLAGVRLAASTDVRAAAVLGLGSPIIAVHPALLEQLSTTQLDQVVVHEWAHVMRKDARATLVQQLLRTLVGWHPAVWWTNRQIHLEREMACDEMVVAVTGAPRAYAACLTYLATLTHAPRDARLAVGAVGASGLQRRVLQVLARDGRTVGAARLATAALVALLVTLALWVGTVRVFSSAIASAALLEAQFPVAQSLVAQSPMTLPGAAQAPAILTPANPVDAVAAIVETQVPRARSAREVAVGIVPDNAALDQQAAESTSASANDVPGEAGQLALPSRSLPAFGVLLVPPLLPSPGGGETAAQPRSPAEATALWNAAADAGGRIGRTSQKGAVTTAGFFTRAAKNMARSF